jgi:hypothetical protein
MQSARVLLVLGVDSILAFSDHLSIEMGAECQRGRGPFFGLAMRWLGL